MPEPEPEPEVLDFTGLSEEEIKQKKKEAKKREKARIMAQLAAISEAKNKLSTVEAGRRRRARVSAPSRRPTRTAPEITTPVSCPTAAQRAGAGEEAQDDEAGEAREGWEGDHLPHAEDR